MSWVLSPSSPSSLMWLSWWGQLKPISVRCCLFLFSPSNTTQHLTWLIAWKNSLPLPTEIVECIWSFSSDLVTSYKERSLLVHPIDLSDLNSDVFKQLLERTQKFSIDFHDRSSGKTTTGSVITTETMLLWDNDDDDDDDDGGGGDDGDDDDGLYMEGVLETVSGCRMCCVICRR